MHKIFAFDISDEFIYDEVMVWPMQAYRQAYIGLRATRVLQMYLF